MKIIKKTLITVLNWLLTNIIYPVHRYFVNLKYNQALAEARILLDQIDDPNGCVTAEVKMGQLEHLREHYRIAYGDLGEKKNPLIDYNDLRNRVNSSLARAEARSRPKVQVIPPAVQERKPIRVC